jgi:uncharacterized protein YndB with AHSA1/START domain
MAIQVAQVSCEVNAPLKSVWGALTTPKTLGDAFFGSRVETTWKVGEPILFRGEWKAKPFEDKGEILTFSQPNRLRFSHFSPLSGVPDVPANYHIVTFDLAASGSKTQVTLSQENANDKPVEAAEQQELMKNWTAILDRLRTAVETR